MIKRHFGRDELVERICASDEEALLIAYRSVKPSVVKYVVANSGTVDDAEDVFQDAIVGFYKKCKLEGVFVGSVKDYLFIASRNIWLKQLRDGKKHIGLDDTVCDEEESQLDDQERKEGRFKLYQLHFLKLPEGCRELIRLSINGLSSTEIAERLGRSEKYIRKRKSECKKFLVERIKSDPNYKRLKN